MLRNYRLPTHEHCIGVRATDIHANSIYFRHLQTTPVRGWPALLRTMRHASGTVKAFDGWGGGWETYPEE